MSKSVTIRIDDNLKQSADEMLEEIGLNMTTYFISSLKALLREKKVPFELAVQQKLNKDYLEKLDKSIAEVEHAEVVKYTINELKELVSDEK